MIKSFLTAISFLTIIPVPGKHENFETSICFFPAAGLLLGLILCGINLLISPFLPSLTVVIVLVTLLVLLTGALHLDGTADTFDALASGKSREEKLGIMRDSRLGAIGGISVICILLLKLGGLYSIPSESLNRALILMPVISRGVLTGACTFFSYAREDEGKAMVFMKNRKAKCFALALLITLVVSVLCLGWKGPIVLAVTAAGGFLLAKLLAGIFGGLTGDTLGMLNESMEVISLLVMGIILR